MSTIRAESESRDAGSVVRKGISPFVTGHDRGCLRRYEDRGGGRIGRVCGQDRGWPSGVSVFSNPVTAPRFYKCTLEFRSAEPTLHTR